jgi:hypothetical protein
MDHSHVAHAQKAHSVECSAIVSCTAWHMIAGARVPAAFIHTHAVSLPPATYNQTGKHCLTAVLSTAARIVATHYILPRRVIPGEEIMEKHAGCNTGIIIKDHAWHSLDHN